MQGGSSSKTRKLNMYHFGRFDMVIQGAGQPRRQHSVHADHKIKFELLNPQEQLQHSVVQTRCSQVIQRPPKQRQIQGARSGPLVGLVCIHLHSNDQMTVNFPSSSSSFYSPDPSITCDTPLSSIRTQDLFPAATLHLLEELLLLLYDIALPSR